MADVSEWDARWRALAAKMANRGDLTPPLQRFIRNMSNTPDESLSHEACQVQLPAYVNDEVAGLDVASLYPLVATHLATCAICEIPYVDLLTLMETLDAEEIQRPSILSLATHTQQVAQAMVTRYFPRLVAGLQTVAQQFIARLQAEGEQAVLQPTVTLGQPLDAVGLLKSTYMTTSRVLPRLDAATRTDAALLQALLRAEAQAVAHHQGLRPNDVARFAEAYTTLIAENPAQLLEL